MSNVLIIKENVNINYSVDVIDENVNFGKKDDLNILFI